MKGKIRVFARIRPMAAYELERNCTAAVTALDEFSCLVKGVKVRSAMPYFLGEWWERTSIRS